MLSGPSYIGIQSQLPHSSSIVASERFFLNFTLLNKVHFKRCRPLNKGLQSSKRRRRGEGAKTAKGSNAVFYSEAVGPVL